MEAVTVGAPLAEPVSLQQAKDHLGITWSDAAQDRVILQKLLASREHVEGLSRRSLALQRWEVTADAFPRRGLMRLPSPPIVQVETVEYLDGAGAWQTLAGSEFNLVRDGLNPSWGRVWPDVGDAPEAVRSTYLAGYAPRLLTFATVAGMEAADAPEAEPQTFARVTSDGDASGFYRWTGAAWEATGYARILPVPEKGIQAVLLLLAHWWVNREDSATGTIVSPQPHAVIALCNALRP